MGYWKPKTRKLHSHRERIENHANSIMGAIDDGNLTDPEIRKLCELKGVLKDHIDARKKAVK